MDKSRRENSAEHSWHIALTVMVLSEYAQDANVDMFRVMKILLEISNGIDTCNEWVGRSFNVVGRSAKISMTSRGQSFTDIWAG